MYPIKNIDMKNIIITVVFCLIQLGWISAQDSSEVISVKKTRYTKNTFLSSYLVNLPTVEMMPKGNMQFMIAHHFGVLWHDGATTGQNIAQFFGFNSGIAKTYLSLDYSLTNHINVGGALAGNGQYEGWLKLRLIRQSNKTPLSVSWLSLVNVNTVTNPADTIEENKLAWNSYSYMHQLLIARKFSPKLSLQIMPTLIHYNIVPYGINNHNNILSLGFGGKYQLSDNSALTFEYARQLTVFEDVLDRSGNIGNYTPDMFSIGMEVNSGGHIFQFFIGNTTVSSNIEQLSRNTNSFALKNFALGFRLNRGFYLGKKDDK